MIVEMDDDGVARLHAHTGQTCGVGAGLVCESRIAVDLGLTFGGAPDQQWLVTEAQGLPVEKVRRIATHKGTELHPSTSNDGCCTSARPHPPAPLGHGGPYGISAARAAGVWVEGSEVPPAARIGSDLIPGSSHT